MNNKITAMLISLEEKIIKVIVKIYRKYTITITIHALQNHCHIYIYIYPFKDTSVTLSSTCYIERKYLRKFKL